MAKKPMAQTEQAKKSRQSEKRIGPVQPSDLRSFAAQLTDLAADLSDVAATLEMLELEHIKVFRKGIVNGIANIKGWMHKTLNPALSSIASDKGASIKLKISPFNDRD